MPVDWSKYPEDWKLIAAVVKLQSEYRCQKCNKQCRAPDEEFDTHQRTLTVAHINHVESDCRPENLVALCPKCHLQYDSQRKVMQRLARNRIERHADIPNAGETDG
jgi:5-methylcytosine-specific restriction endonuclease McrA